MDWNDDDDSAREQAPSRTRRQAHEDEDAEDLRRVCPDCCGSALSPYDDGGSCPHCFNGFVTW